MFYLFNVHLYIYNWFMYKLLNPFDLFFINLLVNVSFLHIPYITTHTSTFIKGTKTYKHYFFKPSLNHYLYWLLILLMYSSFKNTEIAQTWVFMIIHKTRIFGTVSLNVLSVYAKCCVYLYLIFTLKCFVHT